MKKNCCMSKIVWILVIIGAINWGLVGIGGFFDSNWNVVNLIFGGIDWLEYVIYILVGISGVVSLFNCKCNKCSVSSEMKKEEYKEMSPESGEMKSE